MKHFEEILCALGAVRASALLESKNWTLWSAVWETPVSTVTGHYLYLKSKCPLGEATAANLSSLGVKAGKDGYAVVVTPKSDLARDLDATVRRFRGSKGYTTQSLLDEQLLRSIRYRTLDREEFFVGPSMTLPTKVREQDAVAYLRDWLTGGNSTTSGCQIGVLAADGGIGKTTLARELCEQVRHRYPHVFPLLIESDQWKNIVHTGLRLENLWEIAITKRLENSTALRANPYALRVLMQEGLLVVIFDGFDELVAMSADENRPAEVIAELKELFATEDGEVNVRVLLTSRQSYWTAIKGLLPDMKAIEEFRLNGFDNDQRKEYFAKRLKDPAQRDLALRAAAAVSKMYSDDAVEVEKRNEDRLGGTPFMLALIAHAIEGGESVEPYGHDPIEPLLLGVCKREIHRQDLNLTPESQIAILEEIFRGYEEIPHVELDELLQVCGVDDPGVRSRFANHFLLQRIGDSLGSRFEVLKVYFVARFLAKGLQDVESSSSTKAIAEALAKHSTGQNQVGEWVANQLKHLDRTKLKAAVRHAYQIISAPENFATRQRAGMAIFKIINLLVSEDKDKASRTDELLDLIGAGDTKKISKITLAGALKGYDFAGCTFDDCTVVDSIFQNCRFDSNTRFANCRFEGGLDLINCDAAESLDIQDTCVFSPDAELTFSRVTNRTPRSSVREKFAEEALSRALKKFRTDAGFHSIQVRRSLSGMNVKNPYNSEVWKKLLREGVIEHHSISGVLEGGYNVRDEKEIKRDIVQYLDNGIIAGKLRVVFEGLVG